MESTVFYSLIPHKIYQFEAKSSEIKPCPLCLGNISKGSQLMTWKKKQD